MAEPDYPSRRLDTIKLRLPDGMRDELKAAAKANNRTMNAEVVSRLAEFDMLKLQVETLESGVIFEQKRTAIEAEKAQKNFELALVAAKDIGDVRRELANAKKLLKAYDSFNFDFEAPVERATKAMLAALESDAVKQAAVELMRQRVPELFGAIFSTAESGAFDEYADELKRISDEEVAAEIIIEDDAG